MRPWIRQIVLLKPYEAQRRLPVRTRDLEAESIGFVLEVPRDPQKDRTDDEERQVEQEQDERQRRDVSQRCEPEAISVSVPFEKLSRL